MKVIVASLKMSTEIRCFVFPDENACIPPTVPNGRYTESSHGWYENGDVIEISCDEAYEHKDYGATGRCINGMWSSLPICQSKCQTLVSHLVALSCSSSWLIMVSTGSMSACSEPPRVPHAVITGLDYRDLFAADSEVQYECEEGYTINGVHTKKSIRCLRGNWSEGPVCGKWTMWCYYELALKQHYATFTKQQRPLQPQWISR